MQRSCERSSRPTSRCSRHTPPTAARSARTVPSGAWTSMDSSFSSTSGSGPNGTGYVVLPFTVELDVPSVPQVLEVTFTPFLDEIPDRNNITLVSNDWKRGVFEEETNELLIHSADAPSGEIDLGNSEPVDELPGEHRSRRRPHPHRARPRLLHPRPVAPLGAHPGGRPVAPVAELRLLAAADRARGDDVHDRPLDHVHPRRPRLPAAAAVQARPRR